MQIVLNEIKKNDNFLFARIDYKKNRPQIKINIDKDKASDLQISNSEIGRTLEILFLAGRKVNTFLEKGEEYYVILQSKKDNRVKYKRYECISS